LVECMAAIDTTTRSGGGGYAVMTVRVAASAPKSYKTIALLHRMDQPTTMTARSTDTGTVSP